MEIQEFVKDKKLFSQVSWFFGNRYKGRIISRVVAVKYLFQRKISIYDFYRNIFPDKFFKNNDYTKVFHVVEHELLEKIKFTLLGKKIHYRTRHVIRLFADLLFMVQNDQYHVRDFIRPNSIVIDAGANFGIFSCLAASIAKQGRVYAFEPVPQAYRLLVKNAKNFTNIAPIQLGLGEKKCSEKIYYNDENLHLSTLADSKMYEEVEKHFSKCQEINIVGLDEYIAQNQINRVDFLKIDTEGYEKEILVGAKKSIKKFKPVIAVSAYHQKNDKKDIVELVLSIDSTYKYSLSNRGETDLIFHH